MWDDILVSTYPVPSVLEGKSRQYLCNDLNKIRDFILRIWVHSVYSSFVPYLKTEWTTGTELYIDLNGPLDTSDSSSG